MVIWVRTFHSISRCIFPPCIHDLTAMSFLDVECTTNDIQFRLPLSLLNGSHTYNAATQWTFHDGAWHGIKIQEENWQSLLQSQARNVYCNCIPIASLAFLACLSTRMSKKAEAKSEAKRIWPGQLSPKELSHRETRVTQCSSKLQNKARVEVINRWRGMEFLFKFEIFTHSQTCDVDLVHNLHFIQLLLEQAGLREDIAFPQKSEYQGQE